jgi:glycosyltransferase involved in cell wall biosynthesis
MIVSIGILAHNEAGDIGNLISDLGNQILLSNRDLHIEIYVVANGCTDATIDVSKRALAARPFQKQNVKVFIHNVARAGKSNAWNELIHTFASPKTDFIFLLDADIRIPEQTSLQLMLDALVQSKTALVAIDKSVKDLSEKTHKSVIERLILTGSGTAYDIRAALAGGLYCARFSILNGIWMPTGLPGEDGFLRAMILTANFTSEENLERLIFVEGARHIFESERTIRGVFRHNIRLAIGTAINVLLFIHIRGSKCISEDVASYVRKKNAADPNWVNELILNEIRSGKYFILKREFLFKRIRLFSSLPISNKIRKAPILVLGLVFDLTLFFVANHLMRKGAGAGYW